MTTFTACVLIQGDMHHRSGAEVCEARASFELELEKLGIQPYRHVAVRQSALYDKKRPALPLHRSNELYTACSCAVRHSVLVLDSAWIHSQVCVATIFRVPLATAHISLSSAYC